MISFCFRVRFKLGDGVKLESPNSEIVLTDDRDLPELVTLKPWGNALTLGDARQLVLRGEGYESEQHALESADWWNARLQAALARCNIGADFGARAPQGVFTDQGLAIAAGALGRVVLNDVHGTAVFASEPQPTFLGLGADSYVGQACRAPVTSHQGGPRPWGCAFRPRATRLRPLWCVVLLSPFAGCAVRDAHDGARDAHRAAGA